MLNWEPGNDGPHRRTLAVECSEQRRAVCLVVDLLHEVIVARRLILCTRPPGGMTHTVRTVDPPRTDAPGRRGNSEHFDHQPSLHRQIRPVIRSAWFMAAKSPIPASHDRETIRLPHPLVTQLSREGISRLRTSPVGIEDAGRSPSPKSKWAYDTSAGIGRAVPLTRVGR